MGFGGDDRGVTVQSVRSAVTRTVGSGVTQSVAVRLGTRYPERALFVSPPPSSGTLRTERTTDYWSGGETRTFATSRLSYQPTYHVYQNAPTTVFENGVLYNEFDGTTRVTQSGQSLVDGRRISLVAVDGDTATYFVSPEG